ncbi:MerR family transcriptional regulator [Priestia megaterium]|uniref:MerR family transcriptional regulator n=1 Tax=Priestia megaterium TaxID=1404 RepID=UPI002E233953|nr:MerR family transcriptional regulator [Priestia megaterium]MED3976063.1 MerR family transcriptional regulator [Priestia megaterium]
MALEVDYITHGDAHERLGVPATTLRGWVNALEKVGVHYVLRSSRGDRIYEESDIKIFTIVRDIKDEHGMKAQMRDIKYMLMEKDANGEIKLRTREEAPIPENDEKPFNELLNNEDIQDLMNSDRVKQFVSIIIAETQKNLREDLIDEVRESVREEVREEVRREFEASRKAIKLDFEEYNKKAEEELQELRKTLEESSRASRESIESMNKEMKAQLDESNKPKSWWQKLTGK